MRNRDGFGRVDSESNDETENSCVVKGANSNVAGSFVLEERNVPF